MRTRPSQERLRRFCESEAAQSWIRALTYHIGARFTDGEGPGLGGVDPGLGPCFSGHSQAARDGKPPHLRAFCPVGPQERTRLRSPAQVAAARRDAHGGDPPVGTRFWGSSWPELTAGSTGDLGVATEEHVHDLFGRIFEVVARSVKSLARCRRRCGCESLPGPEKSCGITGSSPSDPLRSSPLEGAWQFPDRRHQEPLELPPEDHRPFRRIRLAAAPSASASTTSMS
jgi:hypothetical protein